MSLDEYLQSGLSDRDLGLAEGGLASLPGYDDGGMLLKDRFAKIDRNIASVRTKPNLFFDLVKQAGFVKKDGSADIKKFNKAAAKVGIDTKDRSASNMNRITKFLNKASAGAYKNVGIFSGKSGLENQASRIKGLIGYYAEKYSAYAKKEFWDDAKKLQRKVNKLKISSAEKVKEVARGLKLKWAVPIGTTATLLTKIGFGKALPVVGHLITTEMGSGELPKEGTQEYEELIQGLNEEDEKGLEVTVPLPYTQEKAPTERFKGGGMANIYEMTRPLKKYEHGGLHEEDNILPGNLNKAEIGALLTAGTTREELPYDRSKSRMENENILMRDIGGTLKEKLGLGSLINKVKDTFSPYVMDEFDIMILQDISPDQAKKIVEQSQDEERTIDRNSDTFKKLQKLKQEVHDKQMKDIGRPGYAYGGMAGINQMTRPVHMAGGGDPALKELLNQLKLQLMLEQGMPGSTLMPSGNPDKIKRLEEKIIQIEIELGQ